MKDMEEIRKTLKDRIMGQLPMDQEVDDDQVRDLIDQALIDEGRRLGLTFERNRICPRSCSIPSGVWIYCRRSLRPGR